MPLYEVWEKKTVFLLERPSVPPPVTPPGIWPGPHPSHPIMLPGMPGFGGGGTPPVDPPVIWPGPRPSNPIMLPGMPGWGTPLPPDVKPPVEPPVVLPDLDSPGVWCYLTYPTYTTIGYVQLARITSPGHEPNNPEKGLPGEWCPVYLVNYGPAYAWVPTPESSETPPADTKKK